MKLQAKLAFGTLLLVLSTQSQGGLIVSQWVGNGAGLNNLSGADAAIANGNPDITREYQIIDFTDDPAGNVGVLPGSNPWPFADSQGASGTENPANVDFAALITGQFTVANSDTYTFRTFNDDGVRLRVNGNDVIVDDSYHPEALFFGQIFLPQGTHSLELVFFEGVGEAALELSVAQGTFLDQNLVFSHVGDPNGVAPAVSEIPEVSSSLVTSLLFSLGLFSRKRRA